MNTPVTTPPPPTSKPSVSLVLGGGGARGYAHIGVIEELIARGFDIRSVSGTSMGALIGGIYAAGKLDVYTDWVKPLQRFDVIRLLDWTLSGGGFIKGNRIIALLRELIGEIDISELPIAYTAVAVDLNAHREVWFSDGPLFDAIRASIAIPAIFRPYHYQGRLLVDGGLLNPLPVAPTLRDHNDYTIAVDVNGAIESLGAGPTKIDADDTTKDTGMLERLLPSADSASEQPPSYREKFAAFIASLHKHHDSVAQPSTFELFMRSLDIVQGTITSLKLAAQPPDLLISVPRNACAFYEFHRAEELIELGHIRASEALERWQRLGSWNLP
ncbi:MAG: patatin-like phospholipase family protein [Xanthomonadales bacterium]|nr:patatin-like phospholipase family protein [Xanthomonadales bacterium]